MTSELQKLVKFISIHSEKESAFLSPTPCWSINAHTLLDEISNIWGIPKDELGSTVDEFTKEGG